MKVFITGGAGLLGSALLRNVPKNVTAFATYHENLLLPKVKNVTFFRLDIRDRLHVKKILQEVKPEVIIHTAAKGSPDFCEFHQKEAWDINVIGTRNILAIAEKLLARVLFTSTNQVFSGKNPPYSETSKRDPVNFYGKTKVQTEDDINKSKANAKIIRLMTMYGWGNPKGQKNTAMWVIDMLTQRKSIKVVDDIYNNFLWVGQAVEALWEEVTHDRVENILHIAGKEIENRYEFAQKVAKVFDLSQDLILPVQKSYFKEEAPRPMNTIYNINLFEKTFTTKAVTLSEGLKAMRREKSKVLWEEYEK